MNILDDIIATKRKEIAAGNERVSLETLASEATAYAAARTVRPFRRLFEAAGRGAVIAEIKPRSPSAGVLIEGSPLAVADLYARSEADAVSVLTDTDYFGGSLELLTAARSRLHQPVLRKDFIIDERQMYESVLAGADAYLLIAALLSEEELRRLILLGESLSMDALVETHDEAELERALGAGAKLVGINNRNLKTLEIDRSLAERLSKQVPPGIPVVSESGASTREDVQRLRDRGIRGVLVGTSILKAQDPVAKIAELKSGFLP